MTTQKPSVKTRPWDPAEHIRDDEDAAVYLDVALDEGDHQDVAWALGVIARAKGMAAVAEATGLGRESLYKALSHQGNPEFATILKVVKALGLQLHASVAEAKPES
ncbi:MAG: putative addiction module antidote protein [Chloroflexota bacterium]|nr:putative addiction module antidote protein [Chloroflexota bacterium]